VPHLVAAPDKYRGTASAPEIAAAAAAGARRAGWTATCVPLADGGEGTLDAVGGEPRSDTVAGPLGAPVEAQWRLVTSRRPTMRTAVVEMSRASGLALAGGAARNDPLRATTRGTGELVLAALRAGAGRIVVGCGGSATTDGGTGAVEVLRHEPALRGVELLVACDVTTRFLDAARVFGPQKGASPEQVERLEERLAETAARYRVDLGVDVTAFPGAGAAGGLAGGLVALGGRIVSGVDLVADLVGLEGHLERADLVVTGEGCLDSTSLAGKVVSGVLRHLAGRAPALVVVGTARDVGAVELAAAAHVPTRLVEVESLTELFGATRALAGPAPLVTEVVYGVLSRRP